MKKTRQGKDRLIVLLGPTAVGKTALSIGLAQALRAEIISGDSMLVYRGFDVGTAKPTWEERGGIVHHLIDIRTPEERYSVQEFQQEAGQLIHLLNEKGRLPLLVGGTGLYVQSLLEGYAFNAAGGDAAFRARLQAVADERGGDYIYALLREKDPVAASTIHPHNVRRVIRALEVASTGGESISRHRRGNLAYDVYVIGLVRPRAELYARIDARVRAMAAQGLAAEVRGLLAAGVTPDMQPMQGIGYKEMAAYLAGRGTWEEALAAIARATRHFAKRQLTWFRRMGYIHWFDVSGKSEEKILNEILWNIRGFFR